MQYSLLEKLYNFCVFHIHVFIIFYLFTNLAGESLAVEMGEDVAAEGAL